MQVMDLKAVLELTDSKEQIANLVKALRYDERVWSFLEWSFDSQIDQVKVLARNQQLNPGSLGLLALNQDLLATGYPNNRPPVSILEESMVFFESFIQNPKPQLSLAEATKLALVLFEKQRINNSWTIVFSEIFDRMRITKNENITDFIGSCCSVLINLTKGQDSLLTALLNSSSQWGISLFIHCLLSIPLSEEFKTEKVSEILFAKELGVTSKLIKTLLDQHERDLAECIAKKLIDKSIQSSVVSNDETAILDVDQELFYSMDCRRIAFLAQLAGEYDLADEMISKSIKILETIDAGFHIQHFSILQQSRRFEDLREEQSKTKNLFAERSEIKDELACLNEISINLDFDSEDQSPLLALYSAAKIKKAGNIELAKTENAINFSGNMEKIDRLATFSSQYNPNWNSESVVNAFIDMDSPKEAVFTAQRILQNNPSSVSANRTYANALIVDKRFHDAMEILEMLSISEPNSEEIQRMLAMVYQHLGNFSDSYSIYKKIIDYPDPEVNDYLNFAQAALNLKKSNEVFEITEKVFELDRDNSKALTLNGKAFALEGNSTKAIESFNRAIELNMDDAEPWIALSELYDSADDVRQAIETLRKATSVLPTNRLLKRKLAEQFMETGSATEALPLLKELSRNSNDVDLKILHLEAMKTLGLTEYKDQIKKIFAEFPDNDEISVAYASELIKDGKRSEAKQILENKIDYNENSTQVELLFADSVIGLDPVRDCEPQLISTEELEKAGRSIDKILSNNPDNFRAQILQAEWLIHDKQYEKAYDIYVKLLEQQSSIDKSLIERVQAGFGLAASYIGKFELALAAIKQAVDLKPEWIGLQKLLAKIYAIAGEVNEALHQAEIVLNIAPQMVETMLWFVDFLAGIGKTEEAESKLKEFAANENNELTIQIKLAEILQKNQKLSEAQEIADKLGQKISSELDDHELATLAAIFHQAGNSESALQCLEFRVEKGNNQLAQLELASYYYDMGDFDNALLELEEISFDEENEIYLCSLKADTLMNLGKTQAALELLESCVSVSKPMTLIDSSDFVSKQWLIILKSQFPIEELESRFAFQLGKIEMSLEKAKIWLQGEPENSEAAILVLESHQALGGSSKDDLQLNIEISHYENNFDGHLAALIIDAMIDNELVVEARALFDKFSHIPANLALKAVEIQFKKLAGRLSDAEQLFDELLDEYTTQTETNVVILTGQIRLIIKAAMSLKRWNEALIFCSESANRFNWHVANTMLYLIVLTRSIEFASLAKELSIETHNPDQFLQQTRFEDEINWLITLFSANYETEVERWGLRAKMAISASAEAIKKFAMITPVLDDAAAMVAALHLNNQDPTAIQIAKKFNNDPLVMLELARILSEEKTEEAIEVLDNCISIEPLMPYAMAMRAKLLAKIGKIDMAINDFEQAISDWPNEYMWRLEVANLWQEYGNNKNAIAQLGKAYLYNPQNEIVALNLGQAYLNEGQVEQCINIMRPIIENDPNRYEAWEVIAEAFSQNDEMDEALYAAKKASEINPDSNQPYLISGRIYLKYGNLNQALEQAKIAVSSNNKDANAVLFLAKVLMQQGEKRQALAALEMTNQCENVTAQNMIDHVELVKEINGGAYAKDLIASMSARYPENVELMKMLASTQKEIGDLHEAEVTAKRALQVEPDEPDLHLFLGEMNAESGQLDQAIHHLSQGILNKTDKMDGYLLLSKVYEQQRDFTKALEALSQAMEIEPTDTRSYLAAANLYKNSKDYGSAEKALQKAVEIDPNDVSIRRQLGALLALKLVHHSQEASSKS